MDRRIHITLLILALIFQSAQVGASAWSIQKHSGDLIDLQMTGDNTSQMGGMMDMSPCHEADRVRTEAQEECDTCYDLSECRDACFISSTSGVTALISPRQQLSIKPLSFSIQTLAKKLVTGVHIPIYHPPIHS